MTTRPRPKVAFFDFTCCEGCQLTVVDLLQDHPELLDAVEIVEFREAMSEKLPLDERYAVAFVEGSCTRESDEARLKAIRERADFLIALGACADLGGVNTIRNIMPLQEVREYVYGDKAEWYETYPARPIKAVVKVDAAIPGCPIDRNEFATAVTHLLQGRLPNLPDYPLCIECKALGTVCMYQRGQACLGPVTRAGCGAICPAVGYGCEGCRGFVPSPNLASMREVMREAGVSDDEIESRLRIFLTYQMMELEGATS
ncbi:MAG: NADH:ubiquinone oxidoreductase [Anaerolineae bacterium]|nr:NADH:ubiquinone oxidoreductase [Anaerolineae bacterium]